MKIHEYQAKELFRSFGVSCPQGFVAESADEILAAAEKLAAYPMLIKAQIHAGGRGKGGGVRLVKNKAELASIGAGILGMTLITPQTGPLGKKVNKVLVEQGLFISQEFYLSISIDRQNAGILIVASNAGGMDIEQVAKNEPEKIFKVRVNPLAGIQAHHCREIAFALGLAGETGKQFMATLENLYRLFVDCDCLLVEINPLVLSTAHKFLALDAKVELDTNALFRHKDLAKLADPAEVDPFELAAKAHNLNYIKLDGNVGNMVNGAGLAMATMDLIKNAGADPANFLDVGGGASSEMVENGFRIILSDPNVKAVLINIFGGILRCDVLAQGVVDAARKIDIKVPVVVRMEGTNVSEGRNILAAAGLNLITATDLSDAAGKIAGIVA